ncbi:alkaline phosphatase family protein [Glacieibacterium frigidum]|uniref:Alkaline phosphatase family protein n=1 Tax=Glacieibacterium frigidum TaxID=2593303 RepID=A0A552UF15_9SPHN|nr:alkaline phosphatase family protein [Glacieibacterium frigidum]TRW16828.1 alkaline phosphatase family protein [Glacieibacterium frigidum]
MPIRILAGLAALVTAAAAHSAPPPQPKLIVAIAVDQFSSALFEQYRGRFTGGLKTLSSGVVNASGYQNHAATETCPGHSTILTGRNPAHTGIVANQWYDPDLGRQMYCVEDPAGPVPGRDTAPRGPANLKVPTLGEWMKAANPASRVFAVSGKDRAAIAMAGHNADGTFWWDEERGFNTYVPQGTTAAQRLAPVAGLNAALVKRWEIKAPVWTPSGQCRAGGTDTFGTMTITHTLPPAGNAGGWDEPANLKYFRASPGLDQVTLDAAQGLIDRFKLGRGAAPDLLAISLSASDYVGHRYGGGGPEMCDQLMHLDRMLGVFLAKLAASKVPVVVVLTADHGALDAVERVAKQGIPAQRLTADAFTEVGREVQAEFKLDYFPFAGDAQQITIAGFGERDAKLDARIAASAIERLRKRPEVAAVFSSAEVVAAEPKPGTPPDELTLVERMHESFYPARSGDIQVAYRPYLSGGAPAAPGDYVAGHGSPWNYDRRVPILFWWPGATGFEQPLAVATTDIAPTLAALVGVTPPAVDGRCLDLDGTSADSCAKR